MDSCFYCLNTSCIKKEYYDKDEDKHCYIDICDKKECIKQYNKDFLDKDEDFDKFMITVVCPLINKHLG